MVDSRGRVRQVRAGMEGSKPGRLGKPAWRLKLHLDNTVRAQLPEYELAT